jgi:hypothetical protein
VTADNPVLAQIKGCAPGAFGPGEVRIGDGSRPASSNVSDIGIYVAWLVVPVIVRAVVPEVVRIVMEVTKAARPE